MAKSVNTHRRNVRARTPLSAVGRNAAGVAVAAGLVLTSGLVANADETQAGGAVDSVAPVKAEKLQPAAAPAVEVPAVNIPEGEGFGAPSLPVFSVKAPEKPKEETKPKAESRTEERRAEARAEEPRPADTANRTERRTEAKKSERRAASRSAERREVAVQEQTSDAKPAKKAEKKAEKKVEKKKAPAASASSSAIVNTARRGIGTPYVWGGSGRNGWDCSGFTQWVYRQHGINLPHNDAMQAAMGRRVSRSEARPGDLIRKPGHIGIYVGNGMMIDAGNKRVGTTERKIYSGNWSFYRIGG
ncbi:C40 family peptidase [Dermabacteraceae bacterium TAE3-ERU27]|nr:C40 family peptidase [Dermabacteraceae bacterium TAE3-ERU27]